MLILNCDDVHRALPVPEAIPAMKRALAALSRGDANIPLRTHLDLASPPGTTLVMPGHIDDSAGESLAVKVVSVFPQNERRGLPGILGVVNLLDPETGAPLAILDGAAVTAIRTAATSGTATDLLARPDACHLAIIGAGVQALHHFHAICSVREITRATIHAPRRGKSAALIERLDTPVELVIAESSAEATRDADIICTVTSSQVPVVDDRAIPPGCHINAIGSYKPNIVEIPAETVIRSRLYVDQRGAALAEAGDLVQPLQRGEITARHIVGEIGQLAEGAVPGRRHANEVTLFKSVGNTVEDVVAAQLIFDNARRLGLGQSVDF